MKKRSLIILLFVSANICALAQPQNNSLKDGPYTVNSNSRGFPIDSMYNYGGKWYFDWVYTVPHLRGNFNCLCDTAGGYSGGLFDKYIFATPDNQTSTAAKNFQKIFIRFLMWDEKSNISKINWKNERNIKKEPAKILEFIKDIYVTRPGWVDSCMADFKYLTAEFQKYEKAGLPRGRIPYDALCLTHLDEYAAGNISFDTLFSSRTYYVISDLGYLQKGYYKNKLDSIGLDFLKPYLKIKKFAIGPMPHRDENKEIKIGFIERDIEYIELSTWEAILPQLRRRLELP